MGAPETITADDSQALRKPDATRPGPAAALVLLLEADRPLAGSLRLELDRLEAVSICRRRERCVERLDEERRAVIGVPDGHMSSHHAQLRRREGRWVLEDARSTNGTFLNGAPAEAAPLADGDLLSMGRTFFLFREGAAPLAGADAPLSVRTLSAEFHEALGRAEAVARSTLPVLILGETGTGKEVLARALHAASGRAGPFVAVNCGALSKELLLAELFGARKGAFTGAISDRLGYVRAAEGGTLLLDEIGDLPLDAQAALLRTLQEGEVVPVGAEHPVKVDFRLLCATHRDLDAMAEAGAFRADLLSRIAGYRLRVPPLDARREDLGLLVAALLRRHGGDAIADLTFEPDAAFALLSRRFRRNVRELERALKAALLMRRGPAIRLEDLPFDPDQTPPPATPAPARLSEEELSRRAELERLLREHRGNVTAVARALSKGRTQIQRWMKKYALRGDQFR